MAITRRNFVQTVGLGAGAAALVGYVVIKFVWRRRFLRSLRVARIEPSELKRRLDAGACRALRSVPSSLRSSE